MTLRDTPWWAWAILAGLVFVGWQRWEAMSCPIVQVNSCDDPGFTAAQRERCSNPLELLIPPRP